MVILGNQLQEEIRGPTEDLNLLLQIRRRVLVQLGDLEKPTDVSFFSHRPTH